MTDRTEKTGKICPAWQGLAVMHVPILLIEGCCSKRYIYSLVKRYSWRDPEHHWLTGWEQVLVIYSSLQIQDGRYFRKCIKLDTGVSKAMLNWWRLQTTLATDVWNLSRKTSNYPAPEKGMHFQLYWVTERNLREELYPVPLTTASLP